MCTKKFAKNILSTFIYNSPKLGHKQKVQPKRMDFFFNAGNGGIISKIVNNCKLIKKNSSEQSQNYKEKAVRTLRSSKLEDGQVEKCRKHFSCVISSPSLEQFGTGREPLHW